MSVQLVLDPASVTQTTEYVAQVQEQILAAIRAGMQEAMRGLAGEAVYQAQAAGIRAHTWALFNAILESPLVRETAETIRGTVGTEQNITVNGKDWGMQKHIGLWMEEGYSVPEVRHKYVGRGPNGGHLYAADIYQFTEPDGESFWTNGHRAFDVKPHPFLNPALAEYETTITQIIAEAVDAALDAATSEAQAA